MEEDKGGVSGKKLWCLVCRIALVCWALPLEAGCDAIETRHIRPRPPDA